LQVNSAVRTVAYQRQLIEVNGNAAPAEGDIASPHLTGATIDIAKKGLTMSEVAWMRAYLFTAQTAARSTSKKSSTNPAFTSRLQKLRTCGSTETTHETGALPGTLIAARMR